MLAQRQKLRASGGALQITVPSKAVRECGLLKGDTLDVVYDPDKQKLVIDLSTADKSKIFDETKVAELAA
jgi:hypothetical protein